MKRNGFLIIFLFCTFLLLISCSKDKRNKSELLETQEIDHLNVVKANENQNNLLHANVLDEEKDNNYSNLPEKYKKAFSRIIETGSFNELELYNYSSIEEIVCMLKDYDPQILSKIDTISADFTNIDSLEGLNSFTNLYQIYIRNYSGKSYNGLFDCNISWLYILNSNIMSFEGFESLPLEMLSLERCKLLTEEIKLPNQLVALDLSYIENLKDILPNMSKKFENLEILYIDGINIDSLYEIEYLSFCKNLREIYIRNTNITDNDFYNDTIFKNILINHFAD